MMLGHKIALDPNNKQRTYFVKAAGVARFTYNWALEAWIKQYKEHLKDPKVPVPHHYALAKKFRALKKTEFPWVYEVTSDASKMPFLQVAAAFKNFFSGQSGYPNYRKKNSKERFSLQGENIRVDGKRVKIPRLGWVRMREALRFKGKIMNGTVSKCGERWFISFCVDVEDHQLKPHLHQGSVGIDLGVSALATLSNGEVYIGPKPYRANMERLRRLSRRFNRKQVGSKNHEKARVKLARLEARIANIRRDYLHNMTCDLTRRFDLIGIENLAVGNLMHNHKLARAIADMGLYEFRRQLEYKAAMQGDQIVVASRSFPSTRLCSGCGYVNRKMTLSTRAWTCPKCGKVHERDLNAATNLLLFAESFTRFNGTEGAFEFRTEPLVKQGALWDDLEEMSAVEPPPGGVADSVFMGVRAC